MLVRAYLVLVRLVGAMIMTVAKEVTVNAGCIVRAHSHEVQIARVWRQIARSRRRRRRRRIVVRPVHVLADQVGLVATFTDGDDAGLDRNASKSGMCKMTSALSRIVT